MMVIELKLKAKLLGLRAGKSIVALNSEDAEDLAIQPMDRVEILKGKRFEIALVDITKALCRQGEIGLFDDVAEELKVKEGETLSLHPTEKPRSVEYIINKLNDYPLSKTQIDQIIKDVIDERLSDVELTAFVTASYVRGLNINETTHLTQAIVDSGVKLNFRKKPVVDKHSIGGVPNNRVTMICVPIIAAAGLTIPKTSSRAITAPSGTADTMEVLCPVCLTEERIKEVVKKTGGCIVWGGAINLATADDKLISVRNPLRLDPKGMLLASILAKKKAVGSDIVVIDIPIGKGSKVEKKELAYELASDFVTLGEKLGMRVECLITSGDHPIGYGIGPALEAREVLEILENRGGSMELREKALLMAGKILELAGKAKESKGRDKAEEILISGEAVQKFREIIKAQGGDPKIEPEDIKLGRYRTTISARKTGKIWAVANRYVTRIARMAGAPKNKGAGVLLRVEKGEKISKGQPLFDIYAESEFKLNAAKELAKFKDPIIMEKIVLETYKAQRS